MILNECHVLNQVSANKKITPFEEWEKKRLKLSYLWTWGCLAKVNVPIHKKYKLREKMRIVFCWAMFFIIGIQILDSKI
jgi:hypothetical protein